MQVESKQHSVSNVQALVGEVTLGLLPPGLDSPSELDVDSLTLEKIATRTRNALYDKK